MILFFYGPNQHAARAKLQEMVSRYEAKNPNGMGVERFDGSSTELNQLTEALTTLPFLASSRLVIIEDLSLNKTSAEAILPVLDRVADSTVSIFYEHKPDQRSKFFKTLNKLAKVVKFEQLQHMQLVNWLSVRAQELGGAIGSSVATQLIERAGSDQWRLENELQKLINYDKNISAEAVEEMVEPQFNQSIFDLVEALAAGNTQAALRLYKGLRAGREQPLYILSMVGWQLRNLVMVKAAGSRSPGELAKEAGMSPFVINKARVAAHRLELSTLHIVYKELVQTDFKLKTSAGDPDVLMESLILTMTGQLQAA